MDKTKILHHLAAIEAAVTVGDARFAHNILGSVAILRAEIERDHALDDTAEARMLVRVDDNDGALTFAVAGRSDATEDELRDELDGQAIEAGTWTETGSVCWVTARVPRPKPVPEIEGEVVS